MHYYRILRDITGEEGWRRMHDERTMVRGRYSHLYGLFILAVIGAYIGALTLVVTRLNASWVVRGIISSTISALMVSALDTYVNRLGSRFINMYSNVHEDPMVQNMVNDIWLKMGRPGEPPKVYVSDHVLSMRYNAMAVSGNRIYVARQLINILTPGELYSLLAHEVNHIMHRHVSVGLVAGTILMALLGLWITYAFTHLNSLLSLLLY
ncbi:M48 family metalloprotease [Caldivirga sp.]|uniref:M48 family metalloprotease n=1 Tax=Caldivirga sp. TaxID=2080243 RepID=UPI003D0F6ADD